MHLHHARSLHWGRLRHLSGPPIYLPFIPSIPTTSTHPPTRSLALPPVLSYPGHPLLFCLLPFSLFSSFSFSVPLTFHPQHPSNMHSPTHSFTRRPSRVLLPTTSITLPPSSFFFYCPPYPSSSCILFSLFILFSFSLVSCVSFPFSFFRNIYFSPFHSPLLFRFVFRLLPFSLRLFCFILSLFLLPVLSTLHFPFFYLLVLFSFRLSSSSLFNYFCLTFLSLFHYFQFLPSLHCPLNFLY